MNLTVIGLLALLGASAWHLPSASAEDVKAHRPHKHEGQDHDHGQAKKKAKKQVAKSSTSFSPSRASHVQPTGRSRDVDYPSHGVETEHLFGFTTGSDIGHVGHREVLLDTTSRFGKRVGLYSATTSRVEVGFTPFENFHIAVGAAGSLYRISDVPGLDDRHRPAFEEVSLEARTLLIDRSKGPFGLAVVVEPHIAFVDEVSGQSVRKQAVEFKLVADRELVKDSLFAAVNVLYEPERVRARGITETESTLGGSGALTVQVATHVFAGGEVRYLRKYEGSLLNDFVGDAVFVGPTLFAKISEKGFLSAAWNVQVAGGSIDMPGLHPVPKTPS
jgi:hypothetical protein